MLIAILETNLNTKVLPVMIKHLRLLCLSVTLCTAAVSLTAFANTFICDTERRCLNSSESARYLDAIDHIENERWAEAEVLLANIYGANNQNRIVVNNYAAVLAHQNKMSDAAYILENHLESDPNVGILFKNLVDAYAFLSGNNRSADNNLRLMTAYRQQTGVNTAIASRDNTGTYLSEEERVKAQLNGFIDAWQKGDVNAYLSFYWPEMSPTAGKTYETWRKEREQRVRPEKQIEVSISGVRAKMQDNGDIITTFTQRYSSKGYSDKTKKKVTWRMHSNRWLIVSEGKQ